MFDTFRPTETSMARVSTRRSLCTICVITPLLDVSLYCCQKYWTVSGLGREGVSCGRFVGQSVPLLPLPAVPLLASLAHTSKPSPHTTTGSLS